MELLRTATVTGDPSVLKLDGEVDVSTAPLLRSALEDALAADQRVVVDMAGVTFFDAAGLRVVLQVAAGLNGAAPLTLLHAERVERILELVGMTDLSCIEIRREGAPRGR